MRDVVAMPSEEWGTEFIAFDRNPSRVSVGLAKQVRVVYGDGASPELLKASGISCPRAIVVTYGNDKRCLEATRRLREAFPDTPIIVRAETETAAEPLILAGATEVVVEVRYHLIPIEPPIAAMACLLVGGIPCSHDSAHITVWYRRSRARCAWRRSLAATARTRYSRLRSSPSSSRSSC